ncbi:hypothetical protein DFJ77DRAFT_67985 [Powellomyces hirtus]|nr:hypothetical protein DFJ77DRAFT_67985 [Powellomyces hirtus]
MAGALSHDGENSPTTTNTARLKASSAATTSTRTRAISTRTPAPSLSTAPQSSQSRVLHNATNTQPRSTPESPPRHTPIRHTLSPSGRSSAASIKLSYSSSDRELPASPRYLNPTQSSVAKLEARSPVSPAASVAASVVSTRSAGAARVRKGRVVASRYMSTAAPINKTQKASAPAPKPERRTIPGTIVRPTHRAPLTAARPPVTVTKASPKDDVPPKAGVNTESRRALLEESRANNEITGITLRTSPPAGESRKPAVNAESRRALLEEYRANNGIKPLATPMQRGAGAARTGTHVPLRRDVGLGSTGLRQMKQTSAPAVRASTSSHGDTGRIAQQSTRTGSHATKPGHTRQKLSRIITPQRDLVQAAAIPLPPSPLIPPAAEKPTTAPLPTRREPTLRTDAILDRAAAIPLPPSPTVTAAAPRRMTRIEPPKPPPPSRPPVYSESKNMTSDQMMALEGRCLQWEYLLVKSRNARAEQTRRTESQLLELWKNVTRARQELHDAEMEVAQMDEAIRIIKPLKAQEESLRAVTGALQTFDAAHNELMHGIKRSVVRMPLDGLTVSDPGAVQAILTETAANMEGLMTKNPKSFESMDTLASTLTDTHALAHQAAAELKECTDLARQLAAAAAVEQSYRIGAKQMQHPASTASRRGSTAVDEFAWIGR